ncbi:hypothetical protein GobsT_38170 [Gemmata obscuriglobus]|uniref:hypothetical protein n=1 Tax=Gemmata obscuriglobus TaxID=114 RepID=UPI00016C34E1|nr:hypothetical protein [Gemmata obscuriglobus]QEG29028.1 hypothetical protein GobsT_38170 [Gemmata obscuriglobus]VTS07631.1 Uncharacterized protein OS=Isosphaera pallida (strain ATCC 43644 / DSM 9630 / IS1B) GN=Isop_3573 PE=4 SV=1 [Gemmata obscuriglobus UQM 2246]
MKLRATSVLCAAILAAWVTPDLVAGGADLPVAPTPRAKGTAPGTPGDLHAKQLAAARELLARNAKDGQAAHLEAAWKPVAAVLEASDTGSTTDALRLATDLIPRLRIDIVKPWLVSLMAANPDRGWAVVEALGEHLTRAESALASNPDRRGKLLKLQSAAINAHLATKSANPPQKLIVRFATKWMEEAEAARRAVPPPPPPFQPGRPVQPTRPPARTDHSVSIYDLIDSAPNERFVESLADQEFRARTLESLVRTYLVEGEEAAAFTNIEILAAARHASTGDLLAEFLRTWAKNHNPNPNPAFAQQPIVYGPNGQMISRGQPLVPVTRSLQERNLDELTQLVARIKKLPGTPPDESLLIQAFMSCYTANAIYTRQALQGVFGPPQNLKPDSLARLTEQMRMSVTALRMQLTQQGQPGQAKSTRKPEDLQGDVLAGYAMTRSLLDDALVKQATNWRLALTRAVVMFDELDFQHDIQPKPDFTSRRTEIMAEFARIAGLYAAQVDERDSSPNLTVYEQWFSAALGASDLQGLTEAKLPDPRQPAKIRAAMQSLPGEAGERHVAEFAAALYPKLATVKPAMKPRFLKMGAEVVDNHPRLGPAKKLLNYYKDLSKEVKLEVVLDGPPGVGSMEPFGAFVLLRHTREIEQGSGGFGRFLQNQVGNPMAYNYGRPATNYRDRFENTMSAALGEHFEVVSCTFESDKVVSRPTPEEGWRITPYAYVLLKARGPQVDRLPPLQLDLDFMDGAGFVVLGIESAAVSLDASRRERRPATGVEVTQTVDERHASEGTLKFEIKATARGLVPELAQLLTAIPDGFETVKTDAHALSVVKFDPEAPQPAVRSERTWLLTLKAKPDRTDPNFRFPVAAGSETVVKLQRYRDADIVPASEEIVIGNFGSAPATYRRYAALAVLIGVVCVVAVVAWRLLRRPRPAQRWHGPQVPNRLTPVTVLGYLRSVATQGGLSTSQNAELQKTIQRIEQHYFSELPDEATPPELTAVVNRWNGTAT